MKNMGGIKILFVTALALLILAGTGAAVSLSNSGGGTWKYQREISIKENSGSMLTDYQVLIELKGADFLSEAKSDGADVRFTDSSGNELNYWIESWDYAEKNAKFWVKIQNIPAGSTTTIRMYYGNPSASLTSDGYKVFEFFDDFEASLDTNKWAYISGASLSNSILTLTASANAQGAIRSAIKIESNTITESKIKQLETTLTFPQQGLNFRVNPSGTGKIIFMLDFGAALSYYIDSDGDGSYNWYLENQDGPINDYYHIWSITRLAGKTIFKKDSSVLASPGYGFTDLAYIQLGEYNPDGRTGGTIYMSYDWILVRKYASSEPTVSISPLKSSSLTITKSASPYSLRQFQESTIKVTIENSGNSEAKAIEIMDSIHPGFDLTGGDFPNPKKFDSIRAGESIELQYTIKSKESGSFTLDPATVTYADSEGNIQEVKSEPVSIKVVPSSDGGSSGINTGQNSKSASVSLHGEKTDVVMGEDILLRLSAVNLITKPKMHVQVIIIPPSGMSVTSSEFSKSAAGQFTANYQLEPGDGKDIEVRIRSNQVGDFNVNGRIIYYFGDDKEKAEDQTLNLPIKVRKELVETVPSSSNAENSAKASGFGGGIAIIGLLFMAIYIRKRS